MASTTSRSVRLWTWTRPHKQCLHPHQAYNRRPFMNLFRKTKKSVESTRDPVRIISQDNLFHPFSKSPFSAIKERGEAIKKLAPCPVCQSQTDHDESPIPKAVKFECPGCGWPTHCSEEHWIADSDHKKYCSRLREVNEDDHDLRSGRRVWEFEFPGTSRLFYVEYVSNIVCRG